MDRAVHAPWGHPPATPTQHRHPHAGQYPTTPHRVGTAAYYTDVLAQAEKTQSGGGVALAEGSQLYTLPFHDVTSGR